MKFTYIILIGENRRKEADSETRSEDNIRTDLPKNWCERIKWIEVAQNRVTLVCKHSHVPSCSIETEN
jgi:hypothetical protein